MRAEGNVNVTFDLIAAAKCNTLSAAVSNSNRKFSVLLPTHDQIVIIIVDLSSTVQ